MAVSSAFEAEVAGVDGLIREWWVGWFIAVCFIEVTKCA